MASQKQARGSAGGSTQRGASSQRGGIQPAGKNEAGGRGQQARNDGRGAARQASTTQHAAGGKGGRPRAGAEPAAAQPGSAAQAGAVAAPAEIARPGFGAMLRSMGWLKLTTLVLSVLGLGVSTYLTIQHYTQSSGFAGCPENSAINCVKVTSSSESVVFGIFPVAVLGLAFFIFMVAINSPWAWRSQLPAVRWARLGSVLVGIIFVLYLVYAEFFEIRAICLYCTSVHIITFLLFALIVFQASSPNSTSTTRS